MKRVLRENGIKGFTLMELLVVVAIIALLVAIAIPVFSGSKERANAAVDMSNLRTAYAEASTAVIMQEDVENAKYYPEDGGYATCTVSKMLASYDMKSKIGKAKITPWIKDQSVTVTVYSNGTSEIAP